MKEHGADVADVQIKANMQWRGMCLFVGSMSQEKVFSP